MPAGAPSPQEPLASTRTVRQAPSSPSSTSCAVTVGEKWPACAGAAAASVAASAITAHRIEVDGPMERP